MAHYACKCVDCRDMQKNCVRTCMEDENGKAFYEEMYECGNVSCSVKQGISHIGRELQKIEMKEKKEERKNEKNYHHRTGTGKRRTNHR